MHQLWYRLSFPKKYDTTHTVGQVKIEISLSNNSGNKQEAWSKRHVYDEAVSMRGSKIKENLQKPVLRTSLKGISVP